MIWIWLAVIVVSAILEAISMGLTSVWFTIAGVVSLILALLNVDLWIQVAVFVVLSLILIVFLRKFAKKYLLGNIKSKTNTDLMIGSYVRMLKQSDFDNLGAVEINGVVWGVKSKNGDVLPENSIVKIIAVEGNKLIVEKKED